MATIRLIETPETYALYNFQSGFPFLDETGNSNLDIDVSSGSPLTGQSGLSADPTDLSVQPYNGNLYDGWRSDYAGADWFGDPSPTGVIKITAVFRLDNATLGSTYPMIFACGDSLGNSNGFRMAIHTTVGITCDAFNTGGNTTTYQSSAASNFTDRWMYYVGQFGENVIRTHGSSSGTHNYGTWAFIEEDASLTENAISNDNGGYATLDRTIDYGGMLGQAWSYSRSFVGSISCVRLERLDDFEDLTSLNAEYSVFKAGLGYPLSMKPDGKFKAGNEFKEWNYG